MPLRIASLLVLISAVGVYPQTPAIPGTPAGHVLQAWLDAFNSADRGRLQAYLSKYEPNKALDPQMSFREQTGGFDLIAIDKSDPLQIEFRVREHAGTTIALGKIDLKDPAKLPASASVRSRKASPPPT